MELIAKIQRWGDRHHPKWLDYFRILLGLILMWKGIQFATNLDAFTALMKDASLGKAATISLLAHVIIVLHILGGLMIAVGTQTRIVCLLNLLILFGAVFFVNLREDIARPYSEIWLSSFVLIGLLCFLIEGDGVISIEYSKQGAAQH
ncbi:DoxX family protein [Pedobacter sp. SAFR-022]|uniref:DoxX family protein n=1 Tax=Pedobacter sp. SAFR-022 TaxID=3436861 RepID=UPI003F7FF9C2